MWCSRIDKHGPDDPAFEPPRRITAATVGDGFHLLRVEPAQPLHPRPGQFLWLRAPGVAPRAYRPMRTGAGHIDCLLAADDPLARAAAIEVGGITGAALTPVAPTLLVLGDTAGFAALVHTALTLAPAAERTLALYQAGCGLPFRPRISKVLVPGVPAGVIAALPPLEDALIASRMADPDGLHAGCFDGDAAQLAQTWLTADARGPVQVAASGADALLAAAAALAYPDIVRTDRLAPDPSFSISR